MTNKKFKEILILLISSILAGMAIGIGGTAYLSMIRISDTNSLAIAKFLGAFLFATGLFIIVTYKLELFTGKIGYLVNNKPSYIIDLLIVFLGNFLGVLLFGLLISTADDTLKMQAATLVENKLSASNFNIFLLSIPCGTLMYLAVNTYRKLENSIARYISIFLGVIVFIICGFEHVIANLYYICLGHSISIEIIIPVLLMTLGNSLGSFILPLYEILIKKSSEEKR